MPPGSDGGRSSAPARPRSGCWLLQPGPAAFLQEVAFLVGIRGSGLFGLLPVKKLIPTDLDRVRKIIVLCVLCAVGYLKRSFKRTQVVGRCVARQLARF
eukprot:COSAG01_NODE_3148_length_6514_cov_194.153079_3_plen_99_part_00